VISVKVSGSTKRLESFLNTVSKLDILGLLKTYGAQGVAALSTHTPVRTGLTAYSWDYEVKAKNGVYTIIWTNGDVENGFPVAIMLQYGYGTGTGGYVHGRDYINPAIQPIFDKIASEVWKVVTSA
jgi:hypothetical protein